MFENNKKYSEGWNFGPNDEDILTVEEVIEISIDTWNKGNYIVDNSNQPHEANLLKLDISKARNELKWIPVYNSKEAIEETINWYKEFYENKEFNAKEYSINQINNFVNKAKEKNIEWSINNG